MSIYHCATDTFPVTGRHRVQQGTLKFLFPWSAQPVRAAGRQQGTEQYSMPGHDKCGRDQEREKAVAEEDWEKSAM